jgi:hypothetical protein
VGINKLFIAFMVIDETVALMSNLNSLIMSKDSLFLAIPIYTRQIVIQMSLFINFSSLIITLASLIDQITNDRVK